MEKQYLFYVFLGIFSLTAIITLLGITGILKSIKARYLNVLFSSLILEVIAAVVLLFNNTSFLEDKPLLSDLIYQTDGVKIPEEEAFDYLTKRLRADKNPDNSKADSLRALLSEKESEIERYKGELNQLNRNFYTKIYRLKKAIYQYDNFINLSFNSDKKQEVFTLLQEIFESLQMLPPSEDLKTPDIIKTYQNFKKQYYQAEDPAKYSYIFQSDLSHFIQAYLELSKD